ncbi:hypothetical protein ROHU_011970 [Labeo rohita]|uniref:Uncharacterized protein n=1 Tax=Labeo rohita TaxID=84645 RepID=A0A498LPH5_LABRO|nr:hypothetical protein ROHU_011970 [Labeo rohita]
MYALMSPLQRVVRLGWAGDGMGEQSDGTDLLLEEWDDKKDDMLEQLRTPGPHSLPLRDTGHFLEQVVCICVPGWQDNSWPFALDSSTHRTSFY